MPKPGFLAFHIAAQIGICRDLVNIERGQCWIACLFRGINGTQQHDKDQRHCRQHRPSLPRIAHHLAEGVAQRRRNQQNRQHFNKVAQWRGILKRMCRIDIEEAAAVRPKLFDGNLRRRWTDCNHLFRNRRAFCVS